jgi:hypothetical protein
MLTCPVILYGSSKERPPDRHTDIRKQSPCPPTAAQGLDDRGFVWYTNYESRKGQELGSGAAACLTFWWGDLEVRSAMGLPPYRAVVVVVVGAGAPFFYSLPSFTFSFSSPSAAVGARGGGG